MAETGSGSGFIPGRVAEVAEEVRAANILVVDDMPLMRTMIGSCLTKGGFSNISYAADGAEALAIIDQSMPDLVVLDLNMPKVSGYEVCRTLRSKPETVDLPILVQSASETAQERVQVFASGATDFVSKPINQPELLARVCMHLENKFLIHSLSDFQSRIQAELKMAREMQHSLLPDQKAVMSLEEFCGGTIEAFYKASFELGGDLWGCWPLGDDRVGLFVLDIAGHGVGAALNTFRVHATMARFEIFRDDPADFLTLLNTALQPAFPLGQFATMFYAVLNFKSGELIYAGAGAPRPIILSTDGDVRLLDSVGTPLGIIKSAEYENKYDRLDEGESLFCYSDVLTEAPEPDGKFLGEEGFVRFVSECELEGARVTLVERLLDQFYMRVPGALPDDLTAVAIHRAPDFAALSPDAREGRFIFQSRREAKKVASRLAAASTEPIGVAVGLMELFVNAIEHGCLGIGHDEKGKLLETGGMNAEILRRRALPEYADNYVCVDFKRDDAALRIAVKDPGRGFKYQAFVDDDAGHDKKHGRGITMAKGCFDEMTYHGCGNEVHVVHKING
ncbi:SpoIIE family protein phosphatase [Kordiimonas aestuarii]|uniref:SpoIIE family protein phosphatase n=1 Tax=Kordiimonas aestuarii TaxID=1005925 RepID=UPI0021CE3904|nr:SpoIIE family protein phosphatase [Kordiimonas aestuarii]